jgi:rhomboid family GlyGly-CTERM serine protease
VRALAGAVFLGAGLQLLGGGAATALRYERAAVLGGEPWRLLTGHLVHNGWPHLGLNVATAAVVAALFARQVTVAALLACAGGTGAGLLLLSPDVAWYVGLSGVLHGAIALGMVRAVRAGKRAWLAGLVLLAGKLAWEHFRGPLAGVERMTGAAVVVEAHLYGALAGALWGLPRRRRRR